MCHDSIMPLDDIVGIKEISQRLGVRQQTAGAWHHRGLLPEAEGTVSGAPAWRWVTIEQWARATGRIGGLAEVVTDGVMAWRLPTAEALTLPVGLVVRTLSTPFPQPLTDGRIDSHVRFLANDRCWYQLPHDSYQRAIGAKAEGPGLGTFLLGAAAVIGAAVVADQASKQNPHGEHPSSGDQH
jgi:hypothetical protein